MFFYLSKILTFLIDPMVWVITMLFLSAWKFKGKFKFFALFFVCSIYLLSTHAISNILLFKLENSILLTSEPKEKIEAVIVLGGMIDLNLSNTGEIEFTSAVDRVLKGIEIYKKEKGLKFIFSGGSGSIYQQDGSEALVIKPFIQNMGVKNDDLILESKSRNTHENAVFTSRILKELKLKNVALVTSAFHMYRSFGCFKKADLTVIPKSADFRAKLSVKDFRDYLPSTEGLRMEL